MNKDKFGAKTMGEFNFRKSYAQPVAGQSRLESWSEAIERVFAMHEEKFADKLTPELKALLAKAKDAYIGKRVLGAQRALQFGGAQLRKHEARMYNCASTHCDRLEFFQEAMYLLLCGAGVGFSVQGHHVAKLPELRKRNPSEVKVFQVPDNIEGWADSFGVLLSTFVAKEHATFADYSGKQVHFDFSQIRPKGSLISGGFKAPGPDGLRAALIKVEALLNRTLGSDQSAPFTPIVAYDVTMHMSDAVLSGGVRRSATLCMFDKDDAEMLNAKTGSWFVENPQRGRSNNSAVLVRDELTREEWAGIMKSVRDYGEPGFIFVENKETTFNPCVEIGMRPKTKDGRTGFQFCNLTEINGGMCKTEEEFYVACEAAAILGTLQAGYTDFKYVSSATREITEREALIGVSITGWMNNPEVLFDPEVQRKGAEIVKQVNKKVAEMIGINQAARTTCVKPSGNASILLGTASGIHGEHSPRYFRNVQVTGDNELAQLVKATNPKMVETSVWSAAGTDVVISFPVVTDSGSKYKRDLMGVAQLEYVKNAQQNWVNHGTNVELCADKTLRHNVSNTISVDDWDEVEQYIFDNRQWFAGISLLAAAGDKAYAQAPFTEVLSAEDILKIYGQPSLFASGLVVDGLHAFSGDLWLACSTALGHGLMLTESSEDLLKRDWVRRFEKFASAHFGGDTSKTSYLLKDVHNLHKWVGIEQSLQDVDFDVLGATKDEVDVGSLGAQACAGGVCEISFG